MDVGQLIREVCLLQELVSVNPDCKAYKDLYEARSYQLENIKEDLEG